METTLREVIKQITFKHLKKFKGQVFGQNLTGVGWVAGTLPKLYEKDGVIELPMADVANGGMVTGAALVGRRPFYIIRYQGYNWLNCIFIVNYACKSKEIWNKPAPMFIRGLSSEGGLGPVSTSSHISIFYKMPGIKIYSPMTKNEYTKTYKKFMKSDDVFYVSEHRKSYENKIEFKNTGDITLEDATDNAEGYLVLNSTSGSSTNAGENIDLGNITYFEVSQSTPEGTVEEIIVNVYDGYNVISSNSLTILIGVEPSSSPTITNVGILINFACSVRSHREIALQQPI